MEGYRSPKSKGPIRWLPNRALVTAATPQAYAGATPVDGAGGRGSAWFVDGEAGPAVLKRYRRGGWIAGLSEGAYLWTG